MGGGSRKVCLSRCRVVAWSYGGDLLCIDSSYAKCHNHRAVRIYSFVVHIYPFHGVSGGEVRWLDVILSLRGQ